MPAGHADLPEILHTETVYLGEAHSYKCTLDQTRGMKYGLLKMGLRVAREKQDAKARSFVDYVEDRKRDAFSNFDGGHIMFNFVLDHDKALLYSSQLGGYEGVMRAMEPKPSIAILGIAGRANLNGRPVDCSAVDFVLKQFNWLDRRSQ